METTAKKVSRSIGWGLLVLTLVGIGVGSTIGIQKLQNLVKGSSSSSSSNATSQTSTSSSSSTETKAAMALSLPKYEATSTSAYKAISATIAPDNATFKTITWSVSDSTAIGFSATDGGTTTSAITSESGQNVYIKALKNFSGTVAVVAASTFNNTLKATCNCTYYNGLVSTTWQGFADKETGSTFTASGSFTDGNSHGATWSNGTSTNPTLTMAAGTYVYASCKIFAENPEMASKAFGASLSGVYLVGSSDDFAQGNAHLEVSATATPYWDGSSSHAGTYDTTLCIYYNDTVDRVITLTDKGITYLTLTIKKAVSVSGITASTSTTEF